MKHILNLIICSAVMLTTKAQPGTLDKSFGNNGITITGEYYNYGRALVLQPDGKIILAGNGGTIGINGFFLVRYNTDGSTDGSFGKEGKTITPISRYAEILSIALQPDGKIVAAGYILNQSADADIALARYKPDGSLDSTFGSNGIVITDIRKDDYAWDMTLQEDGKIVATGITTAGENDNKTCFLNRYNPDGSADEGFGDKGVVLATYNFATEMNEVKILPDGKILTGGTYSYLSGSKFMLARYMPDGYKDITFGVNGLATARFDVLPGSNQLNAIALQTDGKIVCAGRTTVTRGNIHTVMAMMRFNSDGTLDNDFGNKGTVVSDFGSTNTLASAVLVQADGKIVMAGSYYNGYIGHSSFAVSRYQANGIPDSSFGENSLTVTDIGESAGANDAILQEDGKIILAGDTYSYNPLSNRFMLARYNGGDQVLATPVEQITAVQNAAGIILNWHTTAETNNDYFVVERSSTAASASFAEFARVDSRGNSTVKQQYAYTDKYPLPGDNYYRLKQTDADGIYSYSAVVHVHYADKGAITIFPNPAGSTLIVQGLDAAETNTISLYDVQGKLLRKVSVRTASHHLSLHGLVPGTYMLRVQNTKGASSHRFVKQ